jgi:isopentenyl phosphate kinase
VLLLEDDATSSSSSSLDDVAIVKVGGSSITHKARKETLQEDALAWFARTVAEHISDHFRAPSAMNTHDDSSSSSSSCRATNGTATATDKKPMAFVLVHGAGSFGHHTAKEFALQGYNSRTTSHEEPTLLRSTAMNNSSSAEHQRKLMQGLVQTRRSVQTLNQLVVQALIQEGVNAVALSPCFGAIPTLPETTTTLDAAALQDLVLSTLRAGLVPVLHGDACLYQAGLREGRGESSRSGSISGIILSGDTIMEMLGSAPWVTRAIFLTDVDGVFTRDPKSDPAARLVHEIAVNGRSSNGDIIAVDDLLLVEASGSTHDHDVTGGLKVSTRDLLTLLLDEP